jgi:hypothetical protein
LAAGRQALSILAEHPRVAADRLGEFGVSWGGFQTWLLNAMDDRLGAAIPIYGCGITRSQVLAYFRGELKPPRRFDPDAWLELYNPIHYVREQRGPTLFLNGTNDFFGWMDTYRQLAEELDGRHRCAFAAQLNHSIGPLNPTLLAWYDCHLRGGVFPAGPAVSGDWTRCGLELHSDAQPGTLATTFFVAPENGIGPGLYWMPVKSRRCRSGFQATVPSSLLGTRHAMVYAHQEFANGVALSSFPIRLAGQPARVQAGKSRLLPVTSEVWYGPAPVNPLNPFIPLRTRKPHLEWKTGVNGSFSFNTRVVALPGYRLSSGAIFRSCLQGPVADPVTVAVLQYAGSPRERRFQGDFCRAELEKGIPMNALKDSNGQGLRTDVQLSHLYIGGKNVRPGVVKLTKASFCRIKHNIQKR